MSRHGRRRVATRPPALVLAAVLLAATTCSGVAVAVSPPAPSVPVAVGRVPAPTSRLDPGPGPGALARSVPVRVRVPAIGLDSRLMDLGLQDDGSLEVPPSGYPAGWYTGAPTPGEIGPAVILGHVDWKGPAVFRDLHELEPGDRVTVTRADGSTPTFRVVRVLQVPKDRFPTESVYGNLDHAGLRLITCGGVVDGVTGHHEDNIVVFADLVTDPTRQS